MRVSRAGTSDVENLRVWLGRPFAIMAFTVRVGEIYVLADPRARAS